MCISQVHFLQYSDFDCRPGNREKLRYSQAELGPTIRSAVAYFADISGGAIEIRVLYSCENHTKVRSVLQFRWNADKIINARVSLDGSIQIS